MVSFAIQKLFSFRRFHKVTVYINFCASHILLRKSSPMLMNSRLFPIFCPIKICVSGLCSGFWSNRTYVFIGICLHSSTCIDPVRSALFAEDLLFPIVNFWILYQKSDIQRCVGLCLSLWFKFIDHLFCFSANTLWVLLL